MARFIPDHPKKGSPEAFAWAQRMQAARAKKGRRIRRSGKKTERQFFGKGGPLSIGLNPTNDELDRLWRYVSSIRNEKKRAFAHAMYNYVVGGQRGFAPDFKKFGIGVMADQAVRLSFMDLCPSLMKYNPGAAWHDHAEQVATRHRKAAETKEERLVYAGMSAAQRSSASASRRLQINKPRQGVVRRNP
ncbi:MAG: hypothetical protein ACRDL7_12835, partial [Gaiellaceae bacterium]